MKSTRFLSAGIHRPLVACLIATLIGACSTGPTNPSNGGSAPVATVTVSPTDATVQVGGTVQLSAQVQDAQGNVLTGRTVTWSSSDGSLASVNGNGVATGEAEGTATIRATSEGQNGTATVTVTAPASGSIALTLVVDGLNLPIHLTAPPDDFGRLFIVEQAGQILIFESGQLLSAPFLDISGLVSGAFEQGLLSMAFHPDYDNNGYFYVNYTDATDATQIVRYTVSSDPNVADAGSAFPILSVAQPTDEHNGGHILFGPDGMLYIGMGDGGTGADSENHGQNPATLLGSLLRIDVDTGSPYAIPSDNPFVGDPSGADETWAYGLRNPWRFAFDPVEDLIFIADVGQNSWEEVNAMTASDAPVNYGWKILEGTNCFSPNPCDPSGLTLPVVEYAHEAGFCSGSVTGGFAYRGNAMPSVQGHYFYADWCQQWVRSFRYVNGQVTEATEWLTDVGAGINSFGEDAAGELYVLLNDGRVMRVVPG